MHKLLSIKPGTGGQKLGKLKGHQGTGNKSKFLLSARVCFVEDYNASMGPYILMQLRTLSKQKTLRRLENMKMQTQSQKEQTQVR
jgi:hypothetical protein